MRILLVPLIVFVIFILICVFATMRINRINKDDEIIQEASEKETESLKWQKFYEGMAQEARETDNKQLTETCESMAHRYKLLAEMERNNEQ